MVGRNRLEPLYVDHTPSHAKVSSWQAIGEQPIEAEGIGVERLAHVGDAVAAQDIEREGAQAGEDTGVVLDAAGILAQGAVAHVVVAVLDPPVPAHGSGASSGLERHLAGVVGDLAPLPPQAGAGVPAPGAARDTNGLNS